MISLPTMQPLKAVDNISTVKEIIQQRYYQDLHYLRLFQLPKKWQEVLNQRIWVMVQSLDLSNCEINDQNISQILKLQWPNLKTLDLENVQIVQHYLNNITEKGLEKLANYEWKQLKKLMLKNNNIKNIGFESLIKKLGSQLIQLQVDNNSINYRGLQILKEPNIEINQLKILFLNRNMIGMKGVQLLVKANFTLQKLSLVGCELCCVSFVTIIKKSNWPTLRSIQLDFNKIGLDGYCSIYENNWKYLKQFTNLQSNEWSQIILMQLILSEWKQKMELSVLQYNLKQKNYQQMRSIIRARFNEVNI